MKGKSCYLGIGFIAGIIYVAACGGGSSISEVATAAAETIGNAVDVIFSNTDSGLTATTAQGAIDEIDGRVDALEESNIESSDLATRLAGTWTGTGYYSNRCALADCSSDDITLTLNAEGSFSCSGSTVLNTAEFLASDKDICSAPLEWNPLTNSILFTYTETGSGEEAFKIFVINYLSSTKLEINDVRYGETYILEKSN